MPYINKQFIENLINQTSIEEYIGQYLELNKSRKCNCPFHVESNASFSIKKDKEFFHCFGCGVAGNVINFIQKYHNLDYPEAVMELSRYKNVDVEFDNTRNEKGVNLHSQIKRICELFQSQLNATAIDYLKSRDITDESIEKFQIGYSYNAIKGFDDNVLLETGVAYKNEYNQTVNILCNKPIFPIVDSSKQVIGFTSRNLTNPSKYGKWKHSKNTNIYTKNKALYGLQTLTQRFVDKIIVVEGVFDVIIPHQNGVNNIVACLGNSLSKEQISLLYKRTNHIVLCFDGDKGGRDGMYKAIENILPFLEGERESSFIEMTDGFDPANKPEDVNNKPIPLSEYLFLEVEKRNNLNLDKLEDKQKFISKSMELISKIKSETPFFLFQKQLKDISGIPINMTVIDNQAKDKNVKQTTLSTEEQAIICLLQEPSNAEIININKNSSLFMLIEDIIENGFITKEEIIEFYDRTKLNDKVLELAKVEREIDTVEIIYKRFCKKIIHQYKIESLFN